ncbi:hypothetical protein [Streptomyces sp. NPDC096030]|uniref:hypothetical protein n=1 Tax=Streptomyces sp. NPDC096030 TaxID=3155423 RepID=UPI0033312A37
MSEIDTVKRREIRSYPVGGFPYGAAFSQAGRLYVANAGDNTVSALTPALGSLYSSPPGSGFDDVALRVAPSGRMAFALPEGPQESWGAAPGYSQQAHPDGTVTFTADEDGRHLRVNEEGYLEAVSGPADGPASRFSAEETGNGGFALKSAASGLYLAPKGWQGELAAIAGDLTAVPVDKGGAGPASRFYTDAGPAVAAELPQSASLRGQAGTVTVDRFSYLRTTGPQTPGTAEDFTIVPAGKNEIALKSKLSGAYVQVNSQNQALVADSGEITPRAVFLWERAGDFTVLKSKETGLYVAAAHGTLHAYNGSVDGSAMYKTELFTFSRLAPAAG